MHPKPQQIGGTFVQIGMHCGKRTVFVVKKNYLCSRITNPAPADNPEIIWQAKYEILNFGLKVA